VKLCIVPPLVVSCYYYYYALAKKKDFDFIFEKPKGIFVAKNKKD
jgi:hypothetical protein